MNTTIKILTQNCKGLRDYAKRKGIFQWGRKKANVIFLQECHTMKEDERSWKITWGNKIFFSHGERNCKGCAILFQKEDFDQITEEITSRHGRLCGMVAKKDDIYTLFLNIYAPNLAHENETLKPGSAFYLVKSLFSTTMSLFTFL